MPKASPPNPELLQFATEEQAVKLQAWIELGSSEKAGKHLGISSTTIRSAKAAVELKAARQGWTPAHGTSQTGLVPEGFAVKGRSTLQDQDGNTVMEWVKTEQSKEQQQEALKEFIKGLCADIKPAKPTKEPKVEFIPELLAAIFIGDAHLGMYAYAKETKHSDFSTDIAAQGLRDAIDNLIDRAPNAEQLLLVDVGDFMHQNSSLNKTLKGTDVDVDTRYSRVLRTAGQVMNYAVSKALTKFKKVTVVVAKGNHNEDPAVAVQEIVSAYFHNEPRVNVLDTDGYFHYIEWGNWLIGVNHGDKVKPAKLVNVMARDMAQAWGRTTHRMWATGHFHHEQVLEMDGCTVYRFGALPPPDSWHAGQGYGGDGQMQMIVFRKEGGKHSTLVYDTPRPIVEPDVVIA